MKFKTTRLLVATLSLASCATTSSSNIARNFEGEPSVIASNRIEIGGTPFVLWGIIPPPKNWQAEEVKAALTSMLEGKFASCVERYERRNEIYVDCGVCSDWRPTRIGNFVVNPIRGNGMCVPLQDVMLRAGMALHDINATANYPSLYSRFAIAENEARVKQSGVWSSQ
ncbi:MAG: hypothetical protein ACK4GK_07255 [Ferrovibrio sp.]